MKKYYTQNPNKKTVTVDYSVKPTVAEERAFKDLLAAGYKLVVKSEARAQIAKDRATEDKLTKEEMLKAVKGTENYDKLVAILNGKGKGHGFFAAKSWYKKNVK